MPEIDELGEASAHISRADAARERGSGAAAVTSAGRAARASAYAARFIASARAAKVAPEPFLIRNRAGKSGVVEAWALTDQLAVTTGGVLVHYVNRMPLRPVQGRFAGLIPGARERRGLGYVWRPLKDPRTTYEPGVLARAMAMTLSEHRAALVDAADASAAAADGTPWWMVARGTVHEDHLRRYRGAQGLLLVLPVALFATWWLVSWADFLSDRYVLPAAVHIALTVLAVGPLAYAAVWTMRKPQHWWGRYVVAKNWRSCGFCGHLNEPLGPRGCTRCTRVL